jgi:release factor glutamine methyltransferase
MNYNKLWHQLAPLYGDGEAKAIAQMVYEVRYGLTLSDIYLGKDTQLSADDQAELKEIAKRLADNEPVQYVLGVADFCGRQYHVEPGILIPRPETEHLCRLITERANSQKPIANGQKVLDIGTGSGCIAITLALDIPGAQVTAWDISPIALRVAKGNAQRLGADVTFQEVDVLTAPGSPSLWRGMGGGLSLIVSNPPYICNKERAEMEQNVLAHEPHTALFVPDDNPLLFYRAIAQYGQSALKTGGSLYFEINPLYASPLREMLSTMSYHDIDIKDDQFGKTRFIQAIR